MFQLSNALTRARIRALCIPLSASEVRAALLFLNLVAVPVLCFSSSAPKVPASSVQEITNLHLLETEQVAQWFGSFAAALQVTSLTPGI
jgi:hypothetical protein